MGASVPKQFLELDGKAILHRTVGKFTDAIPGIKVITVLPGQYIQSWKDYCSLRSFFCRQRIVEGGFTRFHSVKNGLEVSEVCTCEESLEDHFKQVTGGEGIA